MKMKFTDTSRAVQQTTSANMLEMFLLIRTLYTADADVANKEETMLWNNKGTGPAIRQYLSRRQ